MSKQSEAKRKQNYKRFPLHSRCEICQFVKTVKAQSIYSDDTFKCSIGEFKVTANSLCDVFKLQEETNEK